MKSKPFLSFLPLLAAAATVLGGCAGGTGMRGEMLDDETLMTLDGDTFYINQKLTDSLLIVNRGAEYGTPQMLIEHKKNGYFYDQKKAENINAVYGTTDFVTIDDKQVYSVEDGKNLFTPTCNIEGGLIYLAPYNSLYAFSNGDTICFSDNRNVALQHGVRAEKGDGGKVNLIEAAETLAVAPADIYHSVEKTVAEDTTVCHYAKRYYIMEGKEETDAGYAIDLDVPKGKSQSDIAIRRWIAGQVHEDAFSLLEKTYDLPSAKVDDYKTMLKAMDIFGSLWEKLCREENKGGDIMLDVREMGEMSVRKIFETDEIATYYYSAWLYTGGIHELPRSYYITYDKKRNDFVMADGFVKPSQAIKMRDLVLKSIKKAMDSEDDIYDDWDSFEKSVFSFHNPMSFDDDDDADTDSADVSSDEDTSMSAADKAVMASMLVHQYSCDEWSGWSEKEGPFNIQDFPLPHAAILYGGITFTYHPYQIASFGEGEFHPLVPFNEARQCVTVDYSTVKIPRPQLSHFIKIRTKK